jgi:hypothetical protein
MMRKMPLARQPTGAAPSQKLVKNSRIKVVAEMTATTQRGPEMALSLAMLPELSDQQPGAVLLTRTGN